MMDSMTPLECRMLNQVAYYFSTMQFSFCTSRSMALKLSTLIFSGFWISSSMVEQLTLNQLVEGSSPSWSTKYLSALKGDKAVLKKRRSCTFLALWNSLCGDLHHLWMPTSTQPNAPHPHDCPKSFLGNRSSVSDGVSFFQLPHNVAVLLEELIWRN